MKKPNKENKRIKRKMVPNQSAWRNLVRGNIPLEIDLENRQVFFKEEIRDKLTFEISNNNIDNVLKSFVDPKDFKKVKELLNHAGKGIEQPISFNFVHPHTSEKFRFEYRYNIEYVRYSSTRLKGVLVNIS